MYIFFFLQYCDIRHRNTGSYYVSSIWYLGVVLVIFELYVLLFLSAFLYYVKIISTLDLYIIPATA